MYKSIQLIDGLHMYQDHNQDLPFLSDTRSITYDTQSGEVIRDSQPSFTFEGSHTTSIKINLSGRRVTISRGNPSKVNRLDNLFGYTSVDACVVCYNKILISLGLPAFTKCTELFQLMGKDGVRVQTVSNGAVVTEIHTTTNKMVGKGNEKQYLKGISTQRLRNSIPHLAPNGCTVQWLSKLGNAALVHSSVYAKANEIELHQLPKIKRLYGETSEEYKKLQQVHQYCLDQGVVRFENKHKARSLKRQNLQFWGLSDYSVLDIQQKEFLEIDLKLSVNAMTHQTISERLKEEGICKSTQAANSTASYYFMWLQGEVFDFAKTQVRTHRARLRKLHIDIAESCDITKHSAIFITSVTEIEVKSLPIPDWYDMPEKISPLRLVA
jgi:hypothetical protein